jgi:hypothetical protein
MINSVIGLTVPPNRRRDTILRWWAVRTVATVEQVRTYLLRVCTVVRDIQSLSSYFYMHTALQQNNNGNVLPEMEYT